MRVFCVLFYVTNGWRQRQLMLSQITGEDECAAKRSFQSRWSARDLTAEAERTTTRATVFLPNLSSSLIGSGLGHSWLL